MPKKIDYLRIIGILIFFLLECLTYPANAQTCQDNIIASTPQQDFTLLNDGIAEHQTTGLIWARCAWGQQETGQACQKSATELNWFDTLKIVQTANKQQYLGYTGWRVPSLDELKSIIETRCVDPAINTKVFPDTPATSFWSALGFDADSNFAWHIHFSTGAGNIDYKQNLKAVRLVRDVGGQPIDALPGAFSFNFESNVDLNATINSNTITITGLNIEASISIQNGEYQMNNGNWTSSDGLISNGDSVKVRHTSSENRNKSVTSILTIGSISAEFTSTTLANAKDITPDAFRFGLQSNVKVNTRIVSKAILVTGINTAATVSIQNGEYRINEGDWGSVNQTVNNDDTLQMRHTSAATYNTQAISTITVGELSVEFSSRTAMEVVELPELDYGYVEGSVFDACTGQPLAFVNVQFGNVPQQSDKNGEYSIRLENGDYTVSVGYDGYSGDSRTIEIQSNTRYEPFALAPPRGCHAAGAQSYKAVIVAAGGQYIENTFNPIWSSTQLLVDRAYRALKLQGYGDENIYYLSADITPRDADGDGKYDIDDEATLENLEYALTEWAGNVEDVVVYLIGHGGQQVIQLERYTPLPATQLNSWLDDLQTQIPGKLSVVLDACYSGSFIAPLAAKNRYVMTSTRQDLLAVIANNGSTSFSYHFWDEVIFTGQLGPAFRRAKQAMSRQIVGNAPQAALLDADGDRTESKSDYEQISDYCFGACNTKASVSPEIESVGLHEGLAGKLSARLSLTTSTSSLVVNSWFTVQRPDYNFPQDNTAINSLPQFNLDCQSNLCSGVYDNFNLNGEYLLTFYVENQEGQVSLPRSTKILQTGRDDREYSASSVYEPSTGLLTLKDVSAGGLHYYAELQDEGGYAFSLKYLQPLSGATQSRISQFDGQQVIIPSVFAFGDYYAIDLLPEQSLFKLDLGSIKTVKE